MREDLARAQARAEQPTGGAFTALYIGIGFLFLFLMGYTLTVGLGGQPEWITPDSLSIALVRDMAIHWEPWVFGAVGAWIGYKVAKMPVTPQD